jgi:hypothetical protein
MVLKINLSSTNRFTNFNIKINDVELKFKRKKNQVDSISFLKTKLKIEDMNKNILKRNLSH